LSASVRKRRVCARLLAAVAAGAFIASCHEEGSGLHEATPPADVVAVVNGHAITRDAFARYAGSAAGAAESASLGAETRRRLLLRMLDEELLFQRGIALGLHRRDPTARRAILSAVIASVTSEGEAAEPDDATLRTHYEENAERFMGPERVAVEIVFVSDHGRTDAEVRGEAEQVAARLREGEDAQAVLASFPDASVHASLTPSLSLESLVQRAGPPAARAVSQLSPGEVTDPLRGEGGYTVVALRERQPPEAAPFDRVRGEVRVAYLRKRRERALHDALEALHREADIRVLDRDFVTP
jgi:hypothetical protein